MILAPSFLPRRPTQRRGFFVPPRPRCRRCGRTLRARSDPRRLPPACPPDLLARDPRRTPTRNNLVAARSGQLLADSLSGQLFDDDDPCKCCNPCECELSRFDPLWCGDCSWRGATAAVNGVVPCPCYQVAGGIWQKGVASPDGTYCITPRGANDILGSFPCYYTAHTSGKVAAWKGVAEPPPPGYNCDGPLTDINDGCTIRFGAGGGAIGFTVVFATIETYSIALPGHEAGGVFFYGETLWQGWAAVHVISNFITCGPDGLGPGSGIQGVGSAGTVTIIPCCAGT